MKSIIAEKTYQFALKITKLSLTKSYKDQGYQLFLQLLKSGTSIGANIEEAQGSSSKKDFVSKLNISMKEARETQYWIRLLIDSNLVDKDNGEELNKEIIEIIKILLSIILTMKQKYNL